MGFLDLGECQGSKLPRLPRPVTEINLQKSHVDRDLTEFTDLAEFRRVQKAYAQLASR